MDKRLTLNPDVIGLMWTTIDRLPDNLHDFDRDSFGMANLLATCGFELEVLKDPHGALTVTGEPTS